jgi:Chemoreceptor zinc-binding domain
VANQVGISHHECRLGQWYHTGFGAEHYGHLPSYNDIDFPHQMVHKCMGLAVHYLAQDWQRSPIMQEQIIDCFLSVENCTRQVGEILDQIVEEKLRFELSSADSGVAEIEFF